jgi:hypothetical protein
LDLKLGIGSKNYKAGIFLSGKREGEAPRGRQRETGEMIKRLNFWRLKLVFFRRSKVFLIRRSKLLSNYQEIKSLILSFDLLKFKRFKVLKDH